MRFTIVGCGYVADYYLANPPTEFEISSAVLQAGMHVHSEKSLATSLTEARWFVEVAESGGLLLGGALCTVPDETAQKPATCRCPHRIRSTFEPRAPMPWATCSAGYRSAP